MLYHSSPVSGLKILEPYVSSHGKAYVYGIKNAVTALIFGAKKDDFDFIVAEEMGTPVIYECYPNAFLKIYNNKSCSLYEMEEEGFLSGMTSWEPEYVCEKSVDVKKEIKINNLYSDLLDYAEKGEMKLFIYEQTREYKAMISKHIVDRLIRFDIPLEECLEWEDTRFKTYYEPLIKALIEIGDGRYLV